MSPTTLHFPFSLSWTQNSGRFWAHQKVVISIVALITCSAFAALLIIHRKLQVVLPIDSKRFSLGKVELERFSPTEISKVQEGNLAGINLAPTQLLTRLYSYISTQSKPSEVSARPSNYKDWLQWLIYHRDKPTELLAQVEDLFILPSYRESDRLSIEDANEHILRRWIAPLQPWVPLLQGTPQKWHELVSGSLLSPPSIAIPLLFTIHLQLAGSFLRQGLEANFPQINAFIEKYKLYLSLVPLGAAIALRYSLQQGKETLKNLTDNWVYLNSVHRGLDLIPSYQSKLHELLVFINGSNSIAGNNGLNIVWHSSRGDNRVFRDKIGNTLGEMTATGRIFTRQRTSTDFPNLTNLKILELDLRTFLASGGENALQLAWLNMIKAHSKQGNVIVVLKGLSAIEPCFMQQHPNPSFPHPHASDLQNQLYYLLINSLKANDFRCIIEADEKEKDLLLNNKDFQAFFHQIQNPKIPSSELETYIKHIFSNTDMPYAILEQQITELFRILNISIDNGSLDLNKILELFKTLLATCKQSEKNSENVETKKALYLIQKIKEQTLQVLWNEKRTGLKAAEQSLPIMIQLLLIQKVLIPFYLETLTPSRPKFDEPLELTQNHFFRLFGQARPKEEARLRNIAHNIKQKIKGQDVAIDTIAEAALRWRMVRPVNGKPLVFLFAGPSGSGKSDTATFLAYELLRAYAIGDTSGESQLESKILRMGLNQDTTNIPWDWIRANINNFLRRCPSGIIIFEEWDKMDENKRQALLQFFDNSKNTYNICDPEDTLVDKSCATFIITCNTSSKDLSQPIKDNSDTRILFRQDQATVTEGIVKSFGKEQEGKPTLSRIDVIIPFRSTGNDNLLILVDNLLQQHVQLGNLKNEHISRVKELLRQKTLPDDIRELHRCVEVAIFQVNNAL